MTNLLSGKAVFRAPKKRDYVVLKFYAFTDKANKEIRNSDDNIGKYLFDRMTDHSEYMERGKGNWIRAGKSLAISRMDARPRIPYMCQIEFDKNSPQKVRVPDKHLFHALRKHAARHYGVIELDKTGKLLTVTGDAGRMLGKHLYRDGFRGETVMLRISSLRAGAVKVLPHH